MEPAAELAAIEPPFGAGAGLVVGAGLRESEFRGDLVSVTGLAGAIADRYHDRCTPDVGRNLALYGRSMRRRSITSAIHSGARM